ncbi:MAG: hypothetical protein M1813_003897 [Trichoglossum hirsutum]|nr:MAG: hypothetical protein M1813_003897 [Trichoglossum hirsutum]
MTSLLNSYGMAVLPGPSPVTPGNTWSVFVPTYEYNAKLRSFIHSVDALKEGGYVVDPLTDEEILAKRRCENCHKRVKRKRKSPASPSTKCDNCKGLGHHSRECKSPRASAEQQQQQQQKQDEAEIQGETSQEEGGGVPINTGDDPAVTAQATSKLPGGPKEKQQPGATKKKPVCQYHPGRVVNKQFTCCLGRISSDGCIQSDHHDLGSDLPGNLEREWLFHTTPPPLPQLPISSNLSSRQQRRRRHSPAGVPGLQEHRLAVALDCEMGTTQTGESELIRLTAVDFFTGAALVDSLIVPSVPMQHYNTRYSGVTAAMMREASRSGNCIRGRDAAREALWRFVGPETVVVVHGGENDMTALRWICGRVVDTFLLSEDMKKAEALKGGRSLKSLSLELLGRRVQEGKRGHDSLEDALATREVANWFIGVG